MLLLLFLFIVPSMVLSNMCHALRTYTLEARSAAENSEQKTAVFHLEQAIEVFLEYRDGLHLFLNHQDVAELEASLRGALQIARVEMSGQLLMELENILTHLDYVESIERLTLYNLM